MLKRICCIILTVIMVFGIAGCSITKNGLPKYDEHEFIIAGLWAPSDVSEKGFKLYKDAGFTALSFTNHDEQPRTSDNQYYLGSNRTMQALELCKKVGLDAILGYGDTWYVRDIEGEDYFDGTPFSNYDYYEEYKDIIKAIKIKDEPNKEDIDKYKSKTLIDDFKKVYPDADYFVTITPRYANSQAYGFATYEEQLDYYAQNIMSHFENPLIEIDLYPFPNEEHREYPRRTGWLINFQDIAKMAKEYNAEMSVIMQSSAGLEFAKELTEGDMRLQVNMALAFGAQTLKYYCYTVPTINYTYNYCILDPDNKPSDLYYYVQDIHKEIKSFSDVILSYDWDTTTVVNATGIGYNSDIFTMMLNEFENPQYYESGIAVKDLVVSRFTSEKYGEAYMLVNYAPNDDGKNLATITFKNCEKIAIYGGKGFDGEPEIYELDEQGRFIREFEYGDGVFVVPVK